MQLSCLKSDTGSKVMILSEANIERKGGNNACERFHKAKTICGSFKV